MQTKHDTMRILIAGFGGQGLLFLGKLLASIGCARDKQVTWLPSYGPEMRGGTAHCAVIISGEPIGSPIVSQPDVLIAMNLPSFQAYESKVAPGGVILLDASLVDAPPARTDVTYYAIPATLMAADNGLDGLANMILLGKFFESCLPTDDQTLIETLRHVLPEQKMHLIEANLRAVSLGRKFSTAENTQDHTAQAGHAKLRAV